MQIVMEVNDENGNRLWDLASRLGLLCGVAWSDATPGNGFAANLPPGSSSTFPSFLLTRWATFPWSATRMVGCTGH